MSVRDAISKEGTFLDVLDGRLDGKLEPFGRSLLTFIIELAIQLSEGIEARRSFCKRGGCLLPASASLLCAHPPLPETRDSLRQHGTCRACGVQVPLVCFYNFIPTSFIKLTRIDEKVISGRARRVSPDWFSRLTGNLLREVGWGTQNNILCL